MRGVVFVLMIAIGWPLPVGGALAQNTVSGQWAVTGAAAEGATDGGGTWSRRSLSRRSVAIDGTR
jgi:hypothetical protein